jgi:predicted PurR-regulated permease PerM/methylmalonyl-CoA mutase cobalamin-binding subunit
MSMTKPVASQTGVVLITLVAVMTVLHFAQDVLVPAALAVMLAFLLAPLVSRLERWGLNRSIAVTLTTLVAFALLAVLAYLVARQFLNFVDELPSYRDNLLAKIRSFAGGAQGGGLERSVETVKELSDELQKSAPGRAEAFGITRVQIVDPPPNATQVLRGLFGPLIAPLSTASVVIVFVIFMLLQREDLRDRLVRLMGSNQMHTTVTALDDAAQRVSRYLLMQTLINAIQGSIVAIGLSLIGVPNALLWGALTIVLRFIPYLGPLLAAVGPVALAMAYFPGWTEPLMVIGLILTLEMITNNVLEPRLYGSSVGVSSFALIVAAVFWTWLWGTAGLFLATPLTVCLAVMGKYIPQLEFVSVILGDKPVLEPPERVYQRLLANDEDEAQDLVDEAVENTSLLDVLDVIVLPALRFAEQDHERGAITLDKRSALIEQLAELVENIAALPARPTRSGASEDASTDTARADAASQHSNAAGAPALAPAALSVLCLPAADRADALAGELLSRVLSPSDYRIEVMGSATLKGEMLEQVAQSQPDVIFVSAMPPAALVHARYLCQKLRSRFAGVPIIVGLWDAQGDLQKAVDRLTSAGATKIVTRATDAVDALAQLRQPLLEGVAGPQIWEAPVGGAAPSA